jgi:hypothetical protein
METAKETGTTAALGGMQGFNHPIDTGYKYSGHILSFGQMAWNRDFTPAINLWNKASWCDEYGIAN